MRESVGAQLKPVLRPILLILLWICATPGTSAQAQVPQDIAGFRARLVEFSGGMEQAIQEHLERNLSTESDDPYYLRERQLLRTARDAFVRSRHLMPTVSDKDVVRLREAFAQSPQVLDLPRSWLRVVRNNAASTGGSQKATLQTSRRYVDTSSACSGGQYSDTSGGALPIYGLDFAWATQFLDMFLDLFTRYPNNQETPNPGSMQLIPTLTAYQAGVTGQSQCEQAQALLDLIYEMIPDTIASVAFGVSGGAVVEVSVEVGGEIPSPIKQGFGILSSVNKLICLRMALANTLGNNCSLNASFDILDGSVQGMATNIAADIAAHDAKLVAHDVHMTAQHANLVNLINARADEIKGALQAQREFLDRFRGLSVRLAIEKNLLDDGNDVMSIFELPAEGSPPGGIDGVGLDLVRQVVETAIAKSKAAGLPVLQADSELAKGNAATAKAEYRQAFDHYRQAYVNAVK